MSDLTDETNATASARESLWRIGLGSLPGSSGSLTFGFFS
jgi:hypothetical protein